MTTFEVKIICEGGGEPIIIRDKDLFKKFPILERSISNQNPDWEKKNTVLETPIYVPFPREAAEFLFQYVREYESPEKRGDLDTPASAYPEANEKTMEELKYIIEFANYLECTDFMDCMKEVAEYLGLECDGEDDCDENSVWLHPPDDVLLPIEEGTPEAAPIGALLPNGEEAPEPAPIAAPAARVMSWEDW